MSIIIFSFERRKKAKHCELSVFFDDSRSPSVTTGPRGQEEAAENNCDKIN